MPLNHPIPILIVDDEADLRELLVEALTEQGYAAVGADGAAQALALVKDQHFPVIFTDLNMPGASRGWSCSGPSTTGIPVAWAS